MSIGPAIVGNPPYTFIIAKGKDEFDVMCKLMSALGHESNENWYVHSWKMTECSLFRRWLKPSMPRFTVIALMERETHD